MKQEVIKVVVVNWDLKKKSVRGKIGPQRPKGAMEINGS